MHLRNKKLPTTRGAEGRNKEEGVYCRVNSNQITAKVPLVMGKSPGSNHQLRSKTIRGSLEDPRALWGTPRTLQKVSVPWEHPPSQSWSLSSQTTRNCSCFNLENLNIPLFFSLFLWLKFLNKSFAMTQCLWEKKIKTTVPVPGKTEGHWAAPRVGRFLHLLPVPNLCPSPSGTPPATEGTQVIPGAEIPCGTNPALPRSSRFRGVWMGSFQRSALQTPNSLLITQIFHASLIFAILALREGEGASLWPHFKPG